MRRCVAVLLCALSSACGSEPPAPAPAERSPAPTEPETRVPVASSPATAEPPAGETGFLGESEEAVRRTLQEGPIVEIEKGRGGRSLAFRLTLADGTRGYYKPEQRFSAAHFYAELASYYLDRELGLGRVPPTVGRRLEWAPLRAAARGDERIEEIIVQDDGTVRGAFIAWIEGGVEPIAPPDGWTRWLRVSGPLRVNPYQRPREWSRDQSGGSAHAFTIPPAPTIRERPRELSDMILFDYLTTNVDRWGGSFTNVRTHGEGGPLIYLDNGAGFTAGPEARIPLMDARLHALERFDDATVERIRSLDLEALRERMATDPLAPFLNERHWAQLAERREHLLEHVAAVVDEHGAAALFE